MRKNILILEDLGKEQFLNNIALDSVIFGFSNGKLKILIMEYHDTKLFALPGGFVKSEEHLNDAAKRGLKERTGLDDIYLEQFYTFGRNDRNTSNEMKIILEANAIDKQASKWLLGRFVSVAYYALINFEDVIPKPDELSDSCEWYDFDDLPDLIQDHKYIVEKALQTLRLNLERKVIGVNLLPTKFTMKQLQNVYEVILGEKLRRSTFQRKMLGLGILERHEKQFLGAANKAPYLYSFKGKDIDLS